MSYKAVLYNKEKQRVPVKIWSDLHQVESKALDQLKNCASLPFVFKHIAAMPDVHFGMGATVGSVIATKDAICPAAIGTDIGCGVFAVKTPLDYRVVQDKIKEIRHSIERSVPVGHRGHDPNKLSKSVEQWNGWVEWSRIQNLSEKLYKKARGQLGSLGGGNHFIEVCLDTENNVWVMLHSGSRGIGNAIAREHIHKAKGLMKKLFINLPDKDLAYFVTQTEEFDLYFHDLLWLQDYAFQNRVEMMNLVMKDLSYAVFGELKEIQRLEEINCHHNYVAQEHHFGENVYVTRKGAVRARVGDMGIIPGSMGTRSYIVEGLGNPESFDSCSHGAGRIMSRTQAKKQFTLDDLIKQTEGVECRKDVEVIDEIPGAYKDIDVVMENQKDLVKIKYQLKQICCIKG